jgi:hypothetical protein
VPGDAISTGSRVLDYIAEVMGIEHTMLLAKAFRGQRIKVSKSGPLQQEVADVIGAEAAKVFADHFYDTPILFPTREFERIYVKHLAHGTSLSRRQIASKVGISERRVYRYLSEDDPDKQLSFSL